MALVKYGPTIVQASGSIAGSTYARNRFGNYIRARTKPVNPKSPRQVAIRTIMMFLAEAWRESPMDDAKRLAWETYAGSVNWNNKLGEQVTLTGFNMFMRGNAAKLMSNFDFVDDGPADLGLPAGDPAFVVSNASAGGQNFDMVFDDGFDWVDEDDAALIVDIGRPRSASRIFFDGPWRFNARFGGSSVAPPNSPINGAVCPSWTLIEGQVIQARASILRADGRLSTKFGSHPVTVGA